MSTPIATGLVRVVFTRDPDASAAILRIKDEAGIEEWRTRDWRALRASEAIPFWLVNGRYLIGDVAYEARSDCAADRRLIARSRGRK